jgi:hypothetical protein
MAGLSHSPFAAVERQVRRPSFFHLPEWTTTGSLTGADVSTSVPNLKAARQQQCKKTNISRFIRQSRSRRAGRTSHRSSVNHLSSHLPSRPPPPSHPARPVFRASISRPVGRQIERGVVVEGLMRRRRARTPSFRAHACRLPKHDKNLGQGQRREGWVVSRRERRTCQDLRGKRGWSLAATWHAGTGESVGAGEERAKGARKGRLGGGGSPPGPRRSGRASTRARRLVLFRTLFAPQLRSAEKSDRLLLCCSPSLPPRPAADAG